MLRPGSTTASQPAWGVSKVQQNITDPWSGDRSASFLHKCDNKNHFKHESQLISTEFSKKD